MIVCIDIVTFYIWRDLTILIFMVLSAFLLVSFNTKYNRESERKDVDKLSEIVLQPPGSITRTVYIENLWMLLENKGNMQKI